MGRQAKLKQKRKQGEFFEDVPIYDFKTSFGLASMTPLLPPEEDFNKRFNQSQNAMVSSFILYSHSLHFPVCGLLFTDMASAQTLILSKLVAEEKHSLTQAEEQEVKSQLSLQDLARELFSLLTQGIITNKQQA